MHLSSMLEMIESSFDDRILIGASNGRSWDGPRFAAEVRGRAATLDGRSAVVYVGENHSLLPIATFAAAWAGIPFVPINYRLSDDRIAELIGRQPQSLVLADAASARRVEGAKVFDDWLDSPLRTETVAAEDEDAVAVVLFTSGTTAEPKAALLRHRHLMAYLLGAVEFAGADPAQASLIAVPPYHVAGVANMLSNLWSGRRLVYLPSFDADEWIATVERERITHAMVVPTMLTRIVERLDAAGGRPGSRLDSLTSLSYGGARIGERVVRRALELLPHVGFVNAYGLTETASTLSVLGPDDHREAVASDDPAVRARLGSAGRVLPAIEIEIRDASGRCVGPGESGLVFVRGEQIAGEYSAGTLLDDEGWFATRDRGRLDDEGYLFVEGRDDDTIIRGGENIAPAEIEDVLLARDEVGEACVVGLPDDEWGQRIAAVVVLVDGAAVTPDELREWVRSRLRGSKTPDVVVVRTSLPHTDTGKLLRRVVQRELIDEIERGEHRGGTT